jgi:hypothetical protein
MSNPTRARSGRALQTFCSDAARQVHRLETRLRTMVAGADPEPGLQLFEETIQSSLAVAKLVLEAAERGQHATLLAHRPLLRVLSGGRAGRSSTGG